MIKNDRSSNYPHQEINNGINVAIDKSLHDCTIDKLSHTHILVFAFVYFIIENLMRAPLTHPHYIYAI